MTVATKPVREITDPEVEAFERDGWVDLRGFVDPELVGRCWRRRRGSWARPE
jgi:hypothetical protein